MSHNDGDISPAASPERANTVAGLQYGRPISAGAPPRTLDDLVAETAADFAP